MKTMLLATSAIVALSGVSAIAGQHPTMLGPRSAIIRHVHPGPTLYSQNSNFGYSIDSQNFSATLSQTYNSTAADDFIIPRGRIWIIKTVDATGVYFNGSGPANSEVVTLYRNNKGKPGRVVKQVTVTCSDSAGSFSCPVKVKLNNSTGAKKRRYWISVVVNENFSDGGEWGWVENNVTHNDAGQWENPGNGFATNCTSWTNTSLCLSGIGADDFAFDLKGTAR